MEEGVSFTINIMDERIKCDFFQQDMPLLQACVTRSEAVPSTTRMGFHQLLLSLMKRVTCKS